MFCYNQIFYRLYVSVKTIFVNLKDLRVPGQVVLDLLALVRVLDHQILLGLGHDEKKKLLLRTLTKNDVIRESQSPYGSPIHKKENEEKEYVQTTTDYRTLNNKTIKDEYPLLSFIRI